MSDTKLDGTCYEGISVGDIIKAYHAGYHVVTGFHRHSYCKDMIQVDYITVLTNTGKRIRKVQSSALAFCRKIDRQIVLNQYQDELNELNNKRDTILSLLEESHNV